MTTIVREEPQHWRKKIKTISKQSKKNPQQREEKDKKARASTRG